MSVKLQSRQQPSDVYFSMSTDTADGAKSRFETLSKGAVLDVLIPKSDAFDAAAVLRGEDGSLEDLQNVALRRHLFFGR